MKCDAQFGDGVIGAVARSRALRGTLPNRRLWSAPAQRVSSVSKRLSLLLACRDDVVAFFGTALPVRLPVALQSTGTAIARWPDARRFLPEAPILIELELISSGVFAGGTVSIEREQIRSEFRASPTVLYRVVLQSTSCRQKVFAYRGSRTVGICRHFWELF